MDYVLSEICDLLVQPDEDRDDAILEQIKTLKVSLNSRQALLLNNIVDDINNEDAKEKYKAFQVGMLLGIRMANN